MDKPTISVTVTGKISGVSPWDCTLWFATDDLGADLVASTAAFVAAFPEAIQNFGNIWVQLNDPGVTCTGATIRAYAAGSAAAAVQQSVNAAPVLTGTNPPGGPASQACCCTLYSQHPGKSGRGRLYWPATAALSGTYQFPQVTSENLATATKNLYASVRGGGLNGAQSPWVGVVRSLSLGTTNAIIGFGTNTQADRQEHRERHLSFTTHRVSA